MTLPVCAWVSTIVTARNWLASTRLSNLPSAMYGEAGVLIRGAQRTLEELASMEIRELSSVVAGPCEFYILSLVI